MSHIINCIFSILVFCFLLIAPQTTVFAAQTNTQTVFKQAILPVRFAYVDAQGQIDRIWNNVEIGDSLYVIKFFISGTNTEISQSKDLLAQYTKLIGSVSTFSHGDIFNVHNVTNYSPITNLTINFQDSIRGLQEIHTYI